MPTVPRYTRQVSPTPLPDARMTAALTPAAAGVGVHQARAQQALMEGDAAAQKWNAVGRFAGTLGQATGQWTQVILQERERADQVAVMEAENALLLNMNELEINALSQRGKNALGVPESTLATYNEKAGEIAATLSTDRQRWAFNRVRNNRGAQLDMTLRRHTLREMQVYEANQLQAQKVTGLERAVAHYDDPPVRDYEIANVLTGIRQSGPRLGMSPEQIEAEVLDVTTKAHIGVVRQYLANDQPDAAKRYFDDKVKLEEIAGSYQDEVRDALNKGSDRQKAQQQFDTIIGTLPESEWVKAARAIKDPEVRDDVENRVLHQQNVNKTVERTVHEDQVTQAKNIIDSNPGGWLQAIERQMPGAWDKFTLGESGALRSYAERKVSEGTIKTNQGVYSYLLDLAGSEDPRARAKFVETNLMQYLDQLSPSDFQELKKAQVSVRKGDAAAAHSILVNPTIQTAIVNEALVRMGFDPSPPVPGSKDFDSAKAQKVNLFREKVRLQVAAIEASTGKTATDEQVRTIVNEQSAESVKAVPDTWWPNFLFGFGEDPRPASGFGFETSLIPRTIGDVPAAWRADFIAKFRKSPQARTPIDSEILAAYNAIVPQQ